MTRLPFIDNLDPTMSYCGRYRPIYYTTLRHFFGSWT